MVVDNLLLGSRFAVLAGHRSWRLAKQLGVTGRVKMLDDLIDRCHVRLKLFICIQMCFCVGSFC